MVNVLIDVIAKYFVEWHFLRIACCLSELSIVTIELMSHLHYQYYLHLLKFDSNELCVVLSC